jgi:anthranilate phosphoribosyltransferase
MGATLEDLGGWTPILAALTSGEDLTGDQAAAALGDVLEGVATPAQTAAFIVALRMKGETVVEMSGLLRALLDASEEVPIDEDLRARIVDVCGTGGDRSGSINVSTIAALVVAGAGVPVAKHGNRAASSKAGSADVLEALGVRLDVGPDGAAHCLREAGFAFFFAQRFHPGMRYAGPVRRELGVPTVFNFVAPLANPARPRQQLVGVSDFRMAHRMAAVLATNGAHRVIIAQGSDGLDELTTTGPSSLLIHDDGVVSEETVEPGELGLAPATAADLAGGDAAENAASLRAVLAGVRGPHRDIVLLNAAAGLRAAGVVGDLAAGLDVAAASVDGGAAAAALERLVAASNA